MEAGPMNRTREDAWTVLNQHTGNQNLIRHALAVEAAMRAYAVELGEDEEKWGLVGLLHDFDYERFPDEHPTKGAEILVGLGYPADVVHAIRAHAEYSGVPRLTAMDRVLFAVDELCGFITAATLVRPDRRVAELPVQSVRKRLKDKAFARSVNRGDILRGAEELGVDLNEHIRFVINAMAGVAEDLGLAGKE